MTYYRVKCNFDQKLRADGTILVGNELYTAGELKKYRVPMFTVEPVNVKKTETYWFFGARFADGTSYYNG